MATLTIERELDERMGWYTYQVRIDGLDFIGITDATGQAAVDRFKAVATPYADELLRLIQKANQCRDWNKRHPGQGKDWPAFGKLEHMRARLLRQANIRET